MAFGSFDIRGLMEARDQQRSRCGLSGRRTPPQSSAPSSNECWSRRAGRRLRRADWCAAQEPGLHDQRNALAPSCEMSLEMLVCLAVSSSMVCDLPTMVSSQGCFRKTFVVNRYGFAVELAVV